MVDNHLMVTHHDDVFGVADFEQRLQPPHPEQLIPHSLAVSLAYQIRPGLPYIDLASVSIRRHRRGNSRLRDGLANV